MLRVLAVAAVASVVWIMAGAQAAAAARLPVTSVVVGAVVTQGFGCTTLTVEPFDPDCATHHYHTGIDLAAPEGTPVYSATAGGASSGYDAMGCGLYVSVEVDDHVRILYCHLHWAAFAAADVTAGELIGQVGSSGLATGPHLHLEVQVNGRAVDPVGWLSPS